MSKPCANCGKQHDEKRSAFCSPFCKELTSYVRICRLWMRESERQSDPDYIYALNVRCAFLNTGRLGGHVYQRTIPANIRALVWERDKGKCQSPKCKKPGEEIDHIDGDSNDLSNLQLLCKPHHHAKTMAMIQPVTREQIAEINAFQRELAGRIDAPTPSRLADNEQQWGSVWRQWPGITTAPYERIPAKLRYRDLVYMFMDSKLPS